MPSFIAGPYTATYGGSAVGQTAQGYRVSHAFEKQPVTGDIFGSTVQDSIWTGCNVTASFNCIEYNAAAIASLMWPYGTAYLNYAATQPGMMDIISSKTSATVLTAVSGTPAASSPATLTLSATVVDNGANVDLEFGPQLRVVPIRLKCYENGSNVVGTLT